MKIKVMIVVLMTMLSGVMHGQTDSFAEFEKTFKKECADAKIVGATFVLIRDGKAERTFFGSANLAKKQPVDEDTIYHWVSNTKPFTGIAIMQLRDRGLLK